jgi:putative tricarboxylic transport membrane protein
MTQGNSRDVSTPFMAALFVGIGALVIWDTTSYADADSYVFPRTIAAVMIGLSILLVVQWLLGWAPSKEDPGVAEARSVNRRLALVAAMIAAALMMPYIGFILAGALAFAAILLTAMYDPWTPFRIVVYPVAGAVIVGGFYLLFSRVLQVPLPEGTWF